MVACECVAFATEVFLDERKKMGKMMAYADKLEIPHVIIIGPEEIESRKVQLKTLKTGDQSELRLGNLTEELHNLLG